MTPRPIRLAVAALFGLLPVAANAQAVYAGTLGTQPIHLVAYAYSDGVVVAHYAYDRHDTPIRVNGRLDHGVLALQEKDGQGAVVATLRIEMPADEARPLRGQWTPASGKPALPIRLVHQFALDPYSPYAGPPVELPQAASTDEHYFTVLIQGKDADRPPRVAAVNVYRKRTDALVQKIDVDTQTMGIDSVSVGDFNFDGVADFSLFESGYAGPNTTSLYFLRDPAAERYVQADFEGVSLDFDAATKTVHEHNQCCAGRSHENSTYRVVGNRLELIEKQCLEYDEATQDLVEAPCE
jgi:hypothetical protein